MCVNVRPLILFPTKFSISSETPSKAIKFSSTLSGNETQKSTFTSSSKVLVITINETMSIDALLQAAEFLERRDRGESILL